ncbi:hypothetical protein SHKM778_79870 [Streptomyces sp. KM77-8]|uniref:Uncharacterized protein n=1 Tax=Streptomyces haneummycinicus TaxID=3074435 RepID=A0AAT9HW46_9ACTN
MPDSGVPSESVPGTSAGRWAGAGSAGPSGAGHAGAAGGADAGRGAERSAEVRCGTTPFMAIVGSSRGRAGTTDRSYPHAPQKRSPDSRGSSQLGHFDSAAC